MNEIFKIVKSKEGYFLEEYDNNCGTYVKIKGGPYTEKEASDKKHLLDKIDLAGKNLNGEMLTIINYLYTRNNLNARLGHLSYSPDLASESLIRAKSLYEDGKITECQGNLFQLVMIIDFKLSII